MAGVGVILNRNAGRMGDPFRGRVGEKLGFVLGDPDSLQETSRVEEIDNVARSFLDREIDILGIGGGDGSNHYALDTFVRVYGDRPLPRVAFLCGGTHNAHASSIGVRGTPENLMQNIVRKYHTRERFELAHRVLLRIDNGERTHHGFSMATGFMHRFYEDLVVRQDDSAAKVAGLLGSWIGSFLVGGRRIRGIFELEPARVTVGDHALDWPRLNGVSASGMEKLGLGFTPYPRASETPTTFHVAVMRIKPGDLVRLLWAYKRGKVPIHPDARTEIASRVLLEAERPISYVCDGELYRGTKRLEITTGPRIELITG